MDFAVDGEWDAVRAAPGAQRCRPALDAFAALGAAFRLRARRVSCSLGAPAMNLDHVLDEAAAESRLSNPRLGAAGAFLRVQEGPAPADHRAPAPLIRLNPRHAERPGEMA